MTTIPCFAAVATAKAELPAKQIGKTIVFWLLTSYVTSMIVYLFLLPFATSFASSWWSWIIVLVIGGLIVLYVYLYNLLRKNKKVSA
jgi:hypothetical protein